MTGFKVSFVSNLRSSFHFRLTMEFLIPHLICLILFGLICGVSVGVDERETEPSQDGPFLENNVSSLEVKRK